MRCAGHSLDVSVGQPILGSVTDELPTIAREAITVELATRLIRDQFPQWGERPISEVDLPGWDNRTFRLGQQLSIRMPSGPSYALQVAKEQR